MTDNVGQSAQCLQECLPFFGGLLHQLPALLIGLPAFLSGLPAFLGDKPPALFIGLPPLLISLPPLFVGLLACFVVLSPLFRKLVEGLSNEFHHLLVAAAFAYKQHQV